MTASKIVAAAASGAAGAETTDVDDVFSVYGYRGNGYARNIENGIALGNAGEGGSLNGNDNTTGSAQNWIKVPASSDFGFGTGDFTIELFFYMKEDKNYNNLIDFRTSNESNNLPAIYIDGTPNLNYFIGGVGAVISSSVAVGQWYHIAVARSSGTTKMFVNGSGVGSAYTDNTNYATPTAVWSIGAAGSQGAYEINGNLSNVRVVKGTALYTSDFTAPTSALTAVTNTKLLTLQGSTPFVDNSSSAHTLTKQGSPRASEFGPFTGTDGQGGMVFFKDRNTTADWHVYDTERGANKRLMINSSAAEYSGNSTYGLTAFNVNGFNVNDTGAVNNSGSGLCSWSWRKAPKFFDIVTWTGNGGSDRAISHNLDSVPGMIWVRRRNSGEDWGVWHKDVHENTSKVLYLNNTNSLATSTHIFGATNPTSTNFYVGDHPVSNNNGDTYIAYVFAHNNNDGEFGPNSDQDIIKCGTFTSNPSADVSVDLGFEPQFVLVRPATSAGSWVPVDNERSFGHDEDAGGLPWMRFESSATEDVSNYKGIVPESDGFTVKSTYSSSQLGTGVTCIYMAVRRGPLKAPENVKDVFNINLYTGNDTSTSYFPHTLNASPDMGIIKNYNQTGEHWSYHAKVIGRRYMQPNRTNASVRSSGNYWRSADSRHFHLGDDNRQNGPGTHQYVHWMWKRAPEYLDIVHWTGNGFGTRNISHNLGAVPEMMWVKSQSGYGWVVYHKDDGNTEYGYLNTTGAFSSLATAWANTTPTSSVFTVGSNSIVNADGVSYVGMLFGTVSGISKVGSYTGDGNDGRVIDCGFSNGAQFILIKCISHTGYWDWYDTKRGIVAGNDSRLRTPDYSAQNTSYDYVDPSNSGFIVNNTNGDLNDTGRSYIFYAIAAE